jgi:hypothetical protein
MFFLGYFASSFSRMNCSRNSPELSLDPDFQLTFGNFHYADQALSWTGCLHLPIFTNHLPQNHLFEYGLTSFWLIFGLNIDDIWSYQWSYLGEYPELDIPAANLGAVNL